jgi:hypothetical protein
LDALDYTTGAWSTPTCAEKKKQADKQAKVVVCVRKDPLNEENEPEYFQNMNVGLPSPQGRSCQDLPTGCAH